MCLTPQPAGMAPPRDRRPRGHRRKGAALTQRAALRTTRSLAVADICLRIDCPRRVDARLKQARYTAGVRTAAGVS